MKILNQGRTGKCCPFAILGAILELDPSCDSDTMAKAIVSEDKNYLSFDISAKWFIQKGWIKSYRKLPRINPITLSKNPIVVNLHQGNWGQIGVAPFIFSKSQEVGNPGHFVTIAPQEIKNGMVKVKNSWGEAWGDGGYFYARMEDIQREQFWIIKK